MNLLGFRSKSTRVDHLFSPWWGPFSPRAARTVLPDARSWPGRGSIRDPQARSTRRSQLDQDQPMVERRLGANQRERSGNRRETVPPTARDTIISDGTRIDAKGTRIFAIAPHRRKTR